MQPCAAIFVKKTCGSFFWCARLRQRLLIAVEDVEGLVHSWKADGAPVHNSSGPPTLR